MPQDILDSNITNKKKIRKLYFVLIEAFLIIVYVALWMYFSVQFYISMKSLLLVSVMQLGGFAYVAPGVYYIWKWKTASSKYDETENSQVIQSFRNENKDESIGSEPEMGGHSASYFLAFIMLLIGCFMAYFALFEGGSGAEETLRWGLVFLLTCIVHFLYLFKIGSLTREILDDN